MKFPKLLFAVVLTGLAGCATLSRTDRYMLEDHHVTPALYARMIHEEPLSLTDVIELSQRHLSPGFIIHYLSSTYAVYRLDREDIARLRNAKVDQGVINYLMDTVPLYAPRPYGDPYVRPYPYPYYYPYYPWGGGVSVIFDGSGHRHWR